MTDRDTRMKMVSQIIDLVRAAGREILSFYDGETRVRYKADRSPLTAADEASHNLLAQALRDLDPGVPVVSEESEPESVSVDDARSFWLVDPLDGTKEFLKGTGDFTVNVALIEHGEPVLGVVHAPVRDLTYFSAQGLGSWRQKGCEDAGPIRTAKAVDSRLRVVASKDHAGPELTAMLERIPRATVTSIGSSLKFCLVAEGAADLYPRLVPTMEWDTAAAQCIVEAAGGRVTDLGGRRLRYGKTGFRNPSLITAGDPALDWRSTLRAEAV